MMDYNKYGTYNYEKYNYMAITPLQPHFNVVEWYDGNVVTLYHAKAPRYSRHLRRTSAHTLMRGPAWGRELELEAGTA